jgi:hypothetical protein
MAQASSRARRHTLFFDQLSVAAEAVALGSSHAAHWETLAAFVARDGIDRIAETLAQRRGAKPPTREWWRYTLLLSASPSPEEMLRATRALIDIEDAGGGPAFDLERHALQVSDALRYLQEHLARVHAGDASSGEHSAASMVINAVRVARARGR